MTMKDLLDELTEALARADHQGAERATQDILAAAKSETLSEADQQGILQKLRAQRRFDLMIEAAQSFLDNGSGSAQVRRQLAQAKIEQGAFDEARTLLEQVTADSKSPVAERVEALGLRGRILKQEYLALPTGHANARTLAEACVVAYLEAADRAQDYDPWPWVNAISVFIRAQRDGLQPDVDFDPIASAHEVCAWVEKRKAPCAWDLASAAEACIALGRTAQARKWINEYIQREQADVFGLSSTLRQFVHLIGVEDEQLLEPLYSERLRRSGGGTLEQRLQFAEEANPGHAPSVSVLLEVARLDWMPPDDANISVSVRMGTIVGVTCNETSMRCLLEDSDVLSIEVSRPVANGSQLESHQPSTIQGLSSIHIGHSERGRKAIVAVIDTGVDILHKAFLDEHGRSRIIAYWDQTSPSGPAPWAGTQGRVYSAAEIAKLVERGDGIPGQDGRIDARHGTSVTSIAAGRAVGDFGGGVAPEANIVVVACDVEDQSIGYSTSLTAALKFVENVAAQEQLPVVVNVSQGQNGGAHDGSSPLELAFDQFTGSGKRPGRVIVKSAGNERGHYRHASFMLRPRMKEPLRWTGSARDEDALELWFDSACELSCTLYSPTGESTGRLSSAQCDITGEFSGGVRYGMVMERYHADNGDSRIVVSLSRGPHEQVPSGQWQLLIETGDRATGPIHAWLERMGEESTQFRNHQTDDVTLSIPGTARTVISVASIDSSEPDALCLSQFSSYGPTRDGRQVPDVSAPGTQVLGARSGSQVATCVDTGTSMAAPHVTGVIALLLSREPHVCANVVRSRLRNGAGGSWDSGHGCGPLNVRALLGL